MKRMCFTGVFLIAFVFVVAACGGSGSTPASTTSTLGLSITQSNSEILTSLSKGVSGGPAKSVDLGAYSIKCVDGEGNAYTSTITVSGDTGSASVPSIPSGTPVVCYLLDSTGATVTQLTVSSPSTVLGGQYDAPKFSANASNTVVFNPTANGAVVTPDANTAISSSGSTVDPTGRYTMTCVGTFNEATGVEDTANSSTYCTQFAAQGNTEVYLHRISATVGGGTVYGVGAWRNTGAYEICGSTEGLDMLPTGMVLDTAGQDAAFTWDTNFSAFTKDSNTNEIAQMIVSFGNAYGSVLGSTYDAFRASATGDCSWLDTFGPTPLSDEQKTAMCSSMFYWRYINGYMNSNPSSYCVPMINVEYTTEADTPSVAMSAKAGLASHVSPLNRFNFMPLQFMTDEDGNSVGRMSSKEFWTFSSFNPDTNSSVDCVKTMDMLVQFIIPATQPVAGDTITAEFNVDTVVASQAGDSASTLKCNAAQGSGQPMAPNGDILRVIMTKR